MPNWCHNSMTITGSVDEIVRFKQTCLLAHKDGPTLDFEAIKPMPGIFYDDPGQILFPDPDAPKNREQVETQKAFEAQALEATGAAHAYDWACAHWGTPGIASFFHAWRDEPGRYECDFDTRWTPPLFIWEKLGEMFPALDFSVSRLRAVPGLCAQGHDQRRQARTAGRAGDLENDNWRENRRDRLWHAGRDRRCAGNGPLLFGRARVVRR